MNVVRDIADLPTPAAKSVLSIGNFDGVHLGHQAILREAVALAHHFGREMIAMTFDPHPLAVLRPNAPPPLLTPLEEKLRLLDQLGVPTVLVARAEPALLHLTAMDFLTQVVVPRFNPGWLVEGATFGFGRDRGGNVHLLCDVAGQLGFSVTVMHAVQVSGPDGEPMPINSTRIRERVRAGDLAAVSAGLGRPYRLLGRVVRGAQRGRALGFPTANLACGEQLIPKSGVYAGSVQLGYDRYPAAVSIGTNLTFDPAAAPTVEAHLVGFDGDLYGQRIGVDLHRRLRDMVRFDGPEALVAQIRADVAQAAETPAAAP